MPVDLSADLLCVDGLESVTLTDPANGDTLSIASALRREVKASEAGVSNGRYTQHDVKWEIPVVLATTAPRMGGSITDGDGTIWRILAVDKCTLNTRYRCWCRKLEIPADLSQTVDIELGTAVQSTSGMYSQSWSTAYSSLAARIQPIEQTDTREGERRILEQSFRVYLGQDVIVDARHRVYEPLTGRRFRVLRVVNRESLTELPHLEVQLQ